MKLFEFNRPLQMFLRLSSVAMRPNEGVVGCEVVGEVPDIIPNPLLFAVVMMSRVLHQGKCFVHGHESNSSSNGTLFSLSQSRMAQASLKVSGGYVSRVSRTGYGRAGTMAEARDASRGVAGAGGGPARGGDGNLEWRSAGTSGAA